MRYLPLLLITIAIALTGCRPKATSVPIPKSTAPALYADLGPAPELTNETWLNTPEPLRLANLRGKVVLLDMWTFG